MSQWDIPAKAAVAALRLLSVAVVLAPAAATAQVLEIGEGGALTVYDRPAVFAGNGGEAIEKENAAVESAFQPSSSAHAIAALNDAARATGLSPELVEAVAWRESRMRPGLVSRAGAIGEMQLMPGTARDLGVNPYDTRQNFWGGAAYLNAMLRRYNGDLVRALAAYNAGPGAVDRYGGVPPYKETREYVAAVLDRLSRRAAAVGPATAPVKGER